jgi:tight adherence protein B
MMINNWIFEFLPLIALCLLMLAVVLIITFWSRHYSRNAKALNKRLGDIVNMRSAISDAQLMKDASSGDSGMSIGSSMTMATQLEEAIKLMLLRADVEISAMRLVVIAIAIGVMSFLMLLMLTHISALTLLLVSLFFSAFPFFYIMHLQAKRSAKIEKQLPEALDFICRSLRAGHGLSVTFGIVGEELPQPIAKEFKTVFEEINFGLPFNDAMTNFAVRTNSSDINFLVVGLLIQREAGGNLIELLENLSKTIRDRMILKGKIRVLSSEGKYSGILLSVLPFLLGGILTFMNPNYMSLLWTSEAGQELVMVSIVMIIIGALWMWNISRIKV